VKSCLVIPFIQRNSKKETKEKSSKEAKLKETVKIYTRNLSTMLELNGLSPNNTRIYLPEKEKNENIQNPKKLIEDCQKLL